MDLRWTNNAIASAMYVAARLTIWRPAGNVNPSYNSMMEPAKSLESEIASTEGAQDARWRTLLAVAAECEDAEAFYSRASAAEARRPVSVDCLRACEAAFNECCPQFASEMQFRELPLRHNWGAEGPGLLGTIQHLAGKPVREPACTISLVQPVTSGGGVGLSSGANPTVLFEAVMTNEDPRLPETLRLAWLIETVCIDHAMRQASSPVAPSTIRGVLPLAMLPVTLSAGEEIGICGFGLETVAAALRYWSSGLVSEPGVLKAKALAELLCSWWSESREEVKSKGIATSIGRLEDRVTEIA